MTRKTDFIISDASNAASIVNNTTWPLFKPILKWINFFFVPTNPSLHIPDFPTKLRNMNFLFYFLN